jgi:hypothetical protein
MGGRVVPAHSGQTAEPPMGQAAAPAPLAHLEFQPPVHAAAGLLAPVSAPASPYAAMPAVPPAVAVAAPSDAALAARPAAATSLFPRGDSTPGRKCFIDSTAAPCFSHAADYSWIVGQVEYSRIAKDWRLRYASVDETDKFGGRVCLIENHHLTLLHDGQYVRVEGHVVNPDNAGTGPVFYRIESFQGVQDCNAAEQPVSAPNTPH